LELNPLIGLIYILFLFLQKELHDDLFGKVMPDYLKVYASDIADGISELLRLYYQTMIRYPDFPKLILKVMALNLGPGKRFILQLHERGRSSGTEKIAAMVQAGKIESSLDPDVVRLSFVSLAMMPMLLKDVFEQQMGREMDETFLAQLAGFNGHLLTSAFTPQIKE